MQRFQGYAAVDEHLIKNLTSHWGCGVSGDLDGNCKNSDCLLLLSSTVHAPKGNEVCWE